jgi:hypothetical protein
MRKPVETAAQTSYWGNALSEVASHSDGLRQKSLIITIFKINLMDTKADLITVSL